MNTAETTLLSEITSKALNYPDKITSEDFINGYNIVYFHCTRPSSKYEIRGVIIYNLFIEIINDFTINLKAFTSLNSFNEQVICLNKAIVVLEGIFNYLERFYIKCSILRKEDVKNIEEIVKNSYYENHLKNYEDLFFKFFFFDFDNKSVVKEAFKFYRSFTTLEIFKEKYLENLKSGINFKVPIKTLALKIYEEVVKLNNFDENTSKDLSNKLVSYMQPKKEELVELFVKRCEAGKSVAYIYKIISLMCPVTQELFKFKVKTLIFQRIWNCNLNELFSFFKFFLRKIDLEMEKCLVIKGILDLQIKNRINEINKQNLFKDEKSTETIDLDLENRPAEFEDFLASKIDSLESNFEKNEAYTLLFFLKTYGITSYLLGKLKNALKFTLLFSKLRNENSLLKLFSKTLPVDEYYRVKHLMTDISKSREINLNGLELKLLTREFWKLQPENIFLHQKIILNFEFIKKTLNVIYKKAIFNLIATASPVLIDFLGYKITLNTNIYSVLLYIEDHPNISFNDLQSYTNEPFLQEIIDHLLRNHLIINQDNKISLNYEYNYGDLNCFIKFGAIFTPAKKSKTCIKTQSAVMKILKERKKIRISELFQEIKAADLRLTLSELENKGYIGGDNEYVEYKD